MNSVVDTWILLAFLAAPVVGVILKLAFDAKGDVEENRRLGLGDAIEAGPRGFEPIIQIEKRKGLEQDSKDDDLI